MSATKQKPSERIQEIETEMYDSGMWPSGGLSGVLGALSLKSIAIVKYLDELHEQKEKER